jgi:hypothetical protein
MRWRLFLAGFKSLAYLNARSETKVKSAYELIGFRPNYRKAGKPIL